MAVIVGLTKNIGIPTTSYVACKTIHKITVLFSTYFCLPHNKTPSKICFT